MIMTLFKGVKVIGLNSGTAGSVGNEPRINNVTLEMTPDHANVLLLANKKGQMTLGLHSRWQGREPVCSPRSGSGLPRRILGLKAPEAPEAPKVTRPTVTELFSGASRRLQTFKDGLRSDRYAIERFDYNRPPSPLVMATATAEPMTTGSEATVVTTNPRRLDGSSPR